MKKNVFRNFDFVVRQTDKMESNSKNGLKRILFPVLDIYR